MTRTVRFACCATLLFLLPLVASARQGPLAQSTPVSVTATIEAIDKANRTVTLKRANGTSVEIKAPMEMQGCTAFGLDDRGAAPTEVALTSGALSSGISRAALRPWRSSAARARRRSATS